jgi:hypothetical protein
MGAYRFGASLAGAVINVPISTGGQYDCINSCTFGSRRYIQTFVRVPLNKLAPDTAHHVVARMTNSLGH